MHKPPIAKVVNTSLNKHNDLRIDPYYWLKERENDEVINYLNEENDYVKKIMSENEDFQDQLFQEIKGRIKQSDMSVPYFKNGFWYKTRFTEGQEYPIYSRYPNLNSDEQDILDVNAEALNKEYYDIADLSVSPDNKLLAYGEDTVGRRLYTIRFKNLENDQYLETQFSNTDGYVIWANDSRTVYYTIKDETLRSYKVFKHIIGTSQLEDIEIFHELDETFEVQIDKSKSQKYIFIVSEATLSSETLLLDANKPNALPISFLPRRNKLEYNVEHFEDEFFILHNFNALNFALSKATEPKQDPQNWHTIIEPRTNVLVENFLLLKNYIVVLERINANVQVRVINKKAEVDKYIAFKDASYIANFGVNEEIDTIFLRLTYSSLTTPNTVYNYNLNTGELDLLKQEEIVGGYFSDDYVSEKLFISARDGIKVPVSLVYNKNTKIDGSAPLLLYGYGSYGINIDPYFSSARLSLLNRGFIFAIAHIRGGQELGRSWYEEGKLLKKENTFNDFIDVAEYLIQSNYTNRSVMTAMGGSAGGLLIGAVINKRPDLFKAVVAAVPFVDVVTTMLDETIPLTTGEYDEWGNPNDPIYYNYMKSYSPYDNVQKQNYPAILVVTGLHDSQVQYWEPAKWVAKLRAYKTDDNILLLNTNMSTGHGGASGRFQRLKELALEYTFLLKCTGKI